MNRFLKIVLVVWFCAFTSPCLAYAQQNEEAHLASEMTFQTEIYASSSTGAKIHAFYVDDENKYYLFMMAGDSKQVPVTYIGKDGQNATETVDFTSSEEVVLKNTQAGAVPLVFKQSKIPSLHISLNGTTLDQVHADKNIKWAGNTVSIDDATGGNSLVAENVEFKGRGNSSWWLFDKKGYQIKFDKKTSVLGMEKAKKWVLLGNSCDDSLLRNAIAFHLAQQLNMKNSLDCRFVDLWVDGEYLGNYLITEKVEIDKNRVNLTDDDGILFEWDDAYYNEEDYWFKNDLLDAKFSVKETVNEDATHTAQTMNNLNSFLTEFVNVLFKTPVNDLTLAKLNKYIDVESFAQYYLINEYMLNKESVTTSWFWYKDGNTDVLHLGPVWDFDSCMNFYGNTDEIYIFNRNLFTELFRVPAFKEYVSTYYSSHIAVFQGLSAYAKAEATNISKSAEMNYIKWDVLGQEGKTGYQNHDTWNEAVNTTTNWLSSRVRGFHFPDLSCFMHRLYNPNSGEHFYTANADEKNNLVRVGWTYEGVAWTAPTYSGGAAVFRLYNPNAGDHHYTMSEQERDYLVSVGWSDEGIGWYSDGRQRTPLLRQYNPNAKAGSHNFTTSKAENDYLVSIGWKAESIGWYGL